VTVVDPANLLTPLTDYRWIIQEDLTFKVDPTGTPSISTRTLGTSFHRSHMPVVATGCVGTVSCGSGQHVRVDSTTVDPLTGTLGLRAVGASALEVAPDKVVLDPTKHYYISVLPGDAAGDALGNSGHAMGGAEIKPRPPGATSWAPVTVASNSYDWVPAQLSIYIYEDNAPVNNQNDLNEVGLGGFNIILMDAVGRSGDVAGQQTYDSYGMPLSNALLGRPGCPDELNKTTNGAFHGNNKFVGLVYTCPNAPTRTPPPPTATPAQIAAYQAQLAQDAIDYALAGHALILNLTPARYDVIAHPAAERQAAGEEWWQVETLEGTPAQDAFTGVKEPVYFQEFGPPGFHTTIGFVNPARVKKFAIDNHLTGNNTITGKITNERMSRPSDVVLYDSGSYDLLSSTTCQVALNSQAGDGPAIAITQCDHDGNFTLPNIPAGDYEVAIWDQWLDQIIQAKAVTVPASTSPTVVALGNIPVLSWFTQYDQNIFIDTNKNGIYDPTEKGISNVTMTTRYRDGGISMQTATDSNGNGLLAELFPLFNWYVTEADTTRFKQTGVNVIVDGGGAADTTGAGAGIYSSKYATGESSVRVEIPGAYSYGIQGFISQRSTINWGRTPYAASENGGIQGTVVYSTTRPFDDQRYNVQTLWEPLLPRVTVNLYRREKLADGTVTLKLVDTTLTSSFDDWVNQVDASGKQVNMACPGQKATDPFYLYTLGGTDITRCYDGWHNWNQVQAAPYDGRYNFPSAAYIAAPANQLTAAQRAAGQTLVSLPPGDYVVEAVTPPGFDVVKEEDKNILNGDSFVAPVFTQFGGIGNVFILPDQATLNNANPYNLKTADRFANNATADLGVTSSLASQPECVGSLHRVPDYLSLFPAGGLVAPFAGMDRPLCDRKLVKLGDQMQASATFFVFTAVPMAANGTGIILDDATSEFNAAAPDFGEKASVPFVPVSVKDFNGREISRLYSDQWGAYNMMTPSSWLVNPPTPSGYGPNMLVTCMNDPGPIKDPVTGQMITDPQYNPAYSNFCYTLPFMPGRTTYLDTPVLPIAAFAAGYNPADCAYPDATPGIARVDSSAGFGPYLTSAGGTLTISAIGFNGTTDVGLQVPNPSYAGPFALTGPSSLRTVTRHYGFGSTPGSVTVNGVPMTINSWTPQAIVVAVPANGTANVRSGQLVVTAANGKSSVDAVTVTVDRTGGPAPQRVVGANGQTIQAAIEAAAPGDLILVDAGVYNELVIMWKPVRLQGVGAASVIINAAKYPTSKLETWRPAINSLFSVDVTTGNSTATATNPAQIDPLPTQEITGGVVLLEPTVLGSEQGPGITVLAKDLPAGQCAGGLTSTYGKPVTDSNFRCAPSRIDGVSVTGGDAGGGIYVNGWAHKLEISNNRVFGNAGAFNGGVRIGVPYLELTALPTISGNIVGLGYDNDIKIHHNAITKNGTVESNVGAGGAGGGVSICSGTDGYSVDHNWICGNFSAADGGGIGHIGFSQGGKINNNSVLFNQSFQQTSSTHGGGIMVVGEPPVVGTLSLGTGNLTIDSNVIRGNSAEGGHGGGIRLQQVNGADVSLFPANSSKWHAVTVTNNMIVNNVAGHAGGGVSLADTLKSNLVNNTVASNDSTGIAGVVLAGGVALPATTPGVAGRGRPSPAGIVSDHTTTQLLAAIPAAQRAANAISDSRLANNIVWQNRSFFYSGDGRLCAGNSTAPAALATCNTLPNQATTGQPVAGATYWDLGVLGDANPTPGTPRLNPTYSVLTSTAGYSGPGNTNANPQLVDLYVNGSRVTPEFTNVLIPPSVRNMQVAATIDEGNNFVTLRFGPLTLSKPSDANGTSYTAFGDYHLGGGTSSPAYHMGTTIAGLDHDIDGDPRPTAPVTGGQVSGYDIGADQAASSSLRMTVAPSPTLAFGAVSLNTTRMLTVTVTNAVTATANLMLNAPTISAGVGGNSQPARYAFVNHCPVGGGGVAPGTSCTIDVIFAPTQPLSANLQTATLNLSATNTPAQSLGLSGTGVNPLYTVMPLSGNFGNQLVGTTSAVRNLTVTNCLGANNPVGSNCLIASQGNLVFNGTQVASLAGGVNSASTFFALAAPTAGTACTTSTVLAPGQSCTIGVTFTPTSTGAKGIFSNPAQVRLNVASGIANLVVVNLPAGVYGTGVQAAVGFSWPLPYGSLAGGTAAWGTASGARTITVTNTGPSGSQLSLSGIPVVAGGQFSRTGGTCAATTVLNATQTCTVDVTRTRPAAGATAGTLTVTDTGAATASQVLNLSGT
jgi:hypothetical protein